MTNLKCSAIHCFYNKEKLCCLETIQVNGVTATNQDATECGSFKENTREVYTNCACGAQNANRSLEIECNAKKCVYNTNCRCSAPAIDIAGESAVKSCDTECATFQCK